jgi:copper oxidase (laccase) domain-containing protein
MNEVYQSNSSDILAAIGPSISLKNYEVGEELISKFKEAGHDLSSASQINKQTNKWHINLKLIIHNELVRLGVPPQQIETSTLCTFDESELFFSARRQSILCGRMLSGIKLVD